jgi:hypothetical protein
MAKTKRPLTDEEREQRRAQQRQLVAASIEQLRSSDGWQAYLNTRARFPDYSWRNVLLILHQHETAQRVAGFAPGLISVTAWSRAAPAFVSGPGVSPAKSACGRGVTPAAIPTTGRGRSTSSCRCLLRTRSRRCRRRQSRRR